MTFWQIRAPLVTSSGPQPELPLLVSLPGAVNGLLLPGGRCNLSARQTSSANLSVLPKELLVAPPGPAPAPLFRICWDRGGGSAFLTGSQVLLGRDPL